MKWSVIVLLAVCSVVYGTESAAESDEYQFIAPVANHGSAAIRNAYLPFAPAANHDVYPSFEPAGNHGHPATNYLSTTYDRSKLAKRPTSQANFDLNKFLGKWYFQARLASCYWSGSNDFEDWTHVITKGSKSLISSETYAYEGDCSTVNSRYYQIEPNKGCFIDKDSFGGFISGRGVVIATDYTSFSISWLCTKMSGDGHACDDAIVLVKSRKPNPSPKTWKVVEVILKKVWNLSLAEMKRISHTGAC